MQKRFGKVYQQKGQIAKSARQRGTLRSGVGRVTALIDFIPILLDGPHSPVYMFGPTAELDRAFFDSESGMYFELKNISNDGNTIQVQFFEDYDRIDSEWRGIIKIDGVKTISRNAETNTILENKA